MPWLLAAVLTAIFVLIGENIGTCTGTWIYPGQRIWHLSGLGKLGGWFLPLVISFVLVALVNLPEPPRQSARHASDMVDAEPLDIPAVIY